MSRRVAAATLSVVAALTVACASAAAVPQVGQPAPAFSLKTADGHTVSLAELKGTPVIVNFFASWCQPCRTEVPRFLLAMGKHPGLTLLGIAFQDDIRDAQSLRDAIGGDWPALDDPGGKVAAAYGVRTGIPWSFFVDSTGVIRSRHIGEVTDADLTAALATIT